ncbi:MAG: GH3 auxin-responsive promoter family protein [Candidatus Omnitrophica bacterium]|nr:GH3 auxin-responsive promoter family protein [Candidatus Omnitrophota bacterium]
MNIVTLSFKLLEPRRRAFEMATLDPLKAQERVLFEYIRRNKDTEYGRRFGFCRIRSIKDYLSSVPMVDYEDIRPLVDRMASGENNILTKDKPIFFGVTSGTTDKPKLIPTTKYSEAKKDDLMNLWSYYIARDHPDVANGKILAIVSPIREGVTPSGILFGAESGYSYKALPGPVKKLYAIPYEVFEIESYEARHYTILRLAIQADITDIATLNPNAITILCRKIDKWKNLIIEDIEKGTVCGDFDIPWRIRRIIEKGLKADKRRADKLRNIRKEHGMLMPRYIWPNLKLIECWKGGVMGIYLKELESYFGKVPTRDMGCVSTEARSSIPINDTDAGGVLAIQTNFYEFIPREDENSARKRVLLCNELEKDKEYFLVVTTAGGLYRYNIDDIIKVYDFYNKTPMIEFVQKGKGASSLAGEKLYESHVNAALSNVVKMENISLKFFCAVAHPEEGPRYAFLVEFANTDLSEEDKKRFLVSMESELRRQDREYDYVRNAQLLKSPVLKVLRDGALEDYRRRRISEGGQEAQLKAPHLAANTAFEHNFSVEKIIPFPD